MKWQINRLIEIIDLINDGKKVYLSLKEAFELKEFLYHIKHKEERII